MKYSMMRTETYLLFKKANRKARVYRKTKTTHSNSCEKPGYNDNRNFKLNGLQQNNGF